MLLNPIRPAATMILIRESLKGSGLEVYMTKRPATMLFLPEYYVFPGGVMQVEDEDPELFQMCIRQFEEVETSYAITAIRECFEEVGYLLSESVEANIREPLKKGEISFRDWVLSNKVLLRTDKIRYFGHRITPRSSLPLRFDTRYFLTVVPQNIQLIPCDKEVSEAMWVNPRTVLEKAREGLYKMAPPTMDALLELTRFESAEEAFVKARGVGTPHPHELA